LKAGELGAELVRAWWQIGDSVHSPAVGNGCKVPQCFGTLQRDRHSGQHGTARVDDFSDECAGRGALGQCDAWKPREDCQRKNRQKASAKHHDIPLVDATLKTESCGAAERSLAKSPRAYARRQS